MSAVANRPADRLHLWLLTVPADPIPIGELNLVRESRGVSLRYTDDWLDRGFALSEDLPLIDSEFLPRDKETAAGAVDDAVAHVRRVARAVAGWREHFTSCGIQPRDLELLAEQIDRPFLADQRREYE